ncbi:MAG: transporter substrate-binding domain-containing protein [Oscillospiraceae bacterium]|nr:transporter substrate-binding domain-containing protein [Oscillospiraceae bacterium]
MKKILALLLSFTLIFALASCGSSTDSSDSEDNDESANYDTDEDYIRADNTIYVGVTQYEPMDYKDENDEWTGFDADLARGFAEYLGLGIEFLEIDWDNKVLALEDEIVDCVWNGMTLTEVLQNGLACSNAYCKNSQVVVMKKDVVDEYDSVDSLKGLAFAVESGSTGEAAVIADGFVYTAVETQNDTLTKLSEGEVDGAVIDSVMADAVVGDGTDYEDFAVGVSLTDEEFGVAFRKDSNMAEILNGYLSEAYEDGTIAELAETYGISDYIIQP